jgi:hypothetical protein
MKKYIGDLCLVTGVPEEAIFHYTVAIDLLRSVGDVLWTSGSLEGLCAASLLCRAEHKLTSPERPSLQLDISQLSTAGPVNGTDDDDSKTVIPLNDVEIVEKSDEIFQVYEKVSVLFCNDNFMFGWPIEYTLLTPCENQRSPLDE